MTRSRMLKAGGVVGACALAGAAAGIAGSAAAPSKQSARPAIAPPWGKDHPGPPFGLFGAGRDGAGPPVHIVMDVPNSNKTFDTITIDRGTLDTTPTGSTLAFTEGSATGAHRSVSLDVPSSATVRRNGATAKLTDLQKGDEINVVQAPQGWTVIAEDAKHQAGPGPGGMGFERRWHGGGTDPAGAPIPPAGGQMPAGPPPGVGSTN